MMAAIAAARSGAAVTVLEGMDKPGRKLLLTGSGRCNLTNLAKNLPEGYAEEAREFVMQVFAAFSVADTLLFFRSLGLKTYDRDGYVYPVTGQAQSVLQVLLLEMRRLGVKLKCSEKVIGLKKEKNLWNVSTDSWTYEGDAVILSAGSKAYPSTGSDGSGYDLAKMCGHRIHTPRPSLVPVILKEQKLSRELSGIRMPARISVNINRRTYSEKGELQWTDYGISGILVFQLGRYISEELAQKGQLLMTLDLLPFAKESELMAFLSLSGTEKSCSEAFAGILPPKAVQVLLKALDCKPGQCWKNLSEEEMARFIHALKHFTVTAIGTKGMEASQVCAGGVFLKEVDSHSMESKKMPGLFMTGELTDVDGICGGYNLQWAWSSGYLAGKCAAQETSTANNK